MPIHVDEERAVSMFGRVVARDASRELIGTGPRGHPGPRRQSVCPAPMSVRPTATAMNSPVTSQPRETVSAPMAVTARNRVTVAVKGMWTQSQSSPAANQNHGEMDGRETLADDERGRGAHDPQGRKAKPAERQRSGHQNLRGAGRGDGTGRGCRIARASMDRGNHPDEPRGRGPAKGDPGIADGSGESGAFAAQELEHGPREQAQNDHVQPGHRQREHSRMPGDAFGPFDGPGTEGTRHRRGRAAADGPSRHHLHQGQKGKCQRQTCQGHGAQLPDEPRVGELKLTRFSGRLWLGFHAASR